MGTCAKAGPFTYKTILIEAFEMDHSYESVILRGLLSLVETSLAVPLTRSESKFCWYTNGPSLGAEDKNDAVLYLSVHGC